MKTDFDRFILACKQWPTSSVVRQRSVLVPTYLLETASDELRYGDFRLGRTEVSLAAAIDEIAFSLEAQRATAFAVIQPSELAELETGVSHADDPQFAVLANYSEILLVQAFALNGTKKTLLGLTNDYADGIAHWTELDEELRIGGRVGALVAKVAAEWRLSAGSVAV